MPGQEQRQQPRLVGGLGQLDEDLGAVGREPRRGLAEQVGGRPVRLPELHRHPADIGAGSATLGLPPPLDQRTVTSCGSPSKWAGPAQRGRLRGRGERAGVEPSLRVEGTVAGGGPKAFRIRSTASAGLSTPVNLVRLELVRVRAGRGRRRSGRGPGRRRRPRSAHRTSPRPPRRRRARWAGRSASVRAPRDVLPPAGELLVDRHGVVEVGLVDRHLVVPDAVDVVGDADRHLSRPVSTSSLVSTKSVTPLTRAA